MYGFDESAGTIIQVLESSSQFSVFVKALINTNLYEGLKVSLSIQKLLININKPL